MDKQQLIEQANRIINSTRVSGETIGGPYAQALEFLRVYAGPKSHFLETLKTYDTRSYGSEYIAQNIRMVLSSFIEYVQAGLHEGISPERKAQLDVVSDFLEQAQRLLATAGVHPAAPAVLIGATLEEFLRTWVEAANLLLGSRKPSLDSYTQVLRDADLITKQDAKDIIAWAGIRNHAAHGEWDEVSDKKRIQLMLEGVNLFMRKYEMAQ